jgi:hypothetical protein
VAVGYNGPGAWADDVVYDCQEAFEYDLRVGAHWDGLAIDVNDHQYHHPSPGSTSPFWQMQCQFGFLHYSIVWAVIDGVDVVAHNAERLSVSWRTGCMRPLMVLWRRC